MLGMRFIKVQPTTYLMQFRGGRIVREGVGLAFFYYAPTTLLVSVPIASTDAPFIFGRSHSRFSDGDDSGAGHLSGFGREETGGVDEFHPQRPRPELQFG